MCKECKCQECKCCKETKEEIQGVDILAIITLGLLGFGSLLVLFATTIIAILF